MVLFCTDLNGVPLRDWDEGTVAQVAREMSQSDRWTAWIYPQLWGTPYLNKPPLLHGLIAAVFRIWGVHTWTARLPGAVLTATSVPLLFMVGREVLPSRLPALVSALVYLTLLPVVRHGRLAMLDGAVVCFFMATLWLLLRVATQETAGKRVPPLWYLGIGLGSALMCLTKGLLGILLLAIALLYLAWDAPRRLFSLRLWGGLLVGAVPVILWYFLQWQHYGQQFIDTALVNQGAARIWSVVERHQAPPWYYLLELLKYSWPWLIFGPTGLGLTWRFRHHRWAKLILVWTLGYGLPISVMGTKLPWYIFPIYPAIALICGVALAAAWDRHRHWNGRSISIRKLPKFWALGLALFSLLGTIGIVYASPWGQEPSLALALTFLGIAVTAGMAAAFVSWQQIRFLPTLVIGLYLSLLCLVNSDHWVWELGEDFPVLPVAQLVAQNTPAGQVIYTSHGYERPSLNFYSNRRIIPQPAAALQTQWQTVQPTYLLVQDPSPYPGADQGGELGRQEGWYLLRN